MSACVVGVDGCGGGWIAARYDLRQGSFTLRVFREFRELIETYADAAAIGIDIPIGLSECFHSRQCDVDARVLLGPRRSSVFAAPDRRLLNFTSHAEACEFSRAACGKGISLQTFHISKKIAEVDKAITPALQSRLFEVHPEVSFLAAAGSRHLQHSKKTKDGFEERHRILMRVFSGVFIAGRARITKDIPGAGAGDVQPDDVLDAMMVAWTALRYSRGEHERLPSVAEYDRRGLRMEIVF